MDAISGILYGFGIALMPVNLLYCFIGVFIGTLIGVLPGIGSSATLAMLIPLTYGVPTASAIMMLAGICYGAMYGGSTTSILVNIPGEAASVVTCLDGYQMAKQGRAGQALTISAIGSFFAGTFGVALLTLIASPLSDFAIKFGPAEYFSLMLFALTMLSYLGSGSIVKSFAMSMVGIILGTIGVDIVSGIVRFSFGIRELYDGIGLIPVLMGLFGIGELLINVEQIFKREILKIKVKDLLLNKEDIKSSVKPIARGSILGFFLGIIPGPTAIISTFVSYALEKRISRHPEKFGKGAIEGVAAPESANNAAVQGHYVTLFTLGIPGSSMMALLLSAFIIHGVFPGPLLIKNHPDVFWGVVTSMYLGNFMLLVLNLPLIGIWVKLLEVPYGMLFPLIFLFCFIGSYSNINSLMEVNIMLFFGLIGYLMRKTGYEPAPLVLALVLGPMIEEAFRQSLISFHGDLAIFFKRPISASFLTISIILIFLSVIVHRKRKKIVEITKEID
jgi:putative tricarboxylic transport membrane protein